MIGVLEPNGNTCLIATGMVVGMGCTRAYIHKCMRIILYVLLVQPLPTSKCCNKMLLTMPAFAFGLNLQIGKFPPDNHLVIPRVMIRYLNPWPHKDTFFRLSMS